jgi:hypothetical protein
MKLELIEYTCASCEFTFEAAGLGENAYGEFLLRSKRGKLAYLNAIRDPTYKEVDGLLARLPSISRLSPIGRAKILRRVYGVVACDRDDDGSPFEIDAFPICPICRSSAISSWRFKSPPAFVDVEVPPVTHVEWGGLSEVTKVDWLRAELAPDPSGALRMRAG